MELLLSCNYMILLTCDILKCTGLWFRMWIIILILLSLSPNKNDFITLVFYISGLFFFFAYLFYLFVWLFIVLIMAHRTFALCCGGRRALSCGIRDLVPWLEIRSGPPASVVWSLNHWTTREVPYQFLNEEIRLNCALKAFSSTDFNSRLRRNMFWSYLPHKTCNII